MSKLSAKATRERKELAKYTKHILKTSYIGSDENLKMAAAQTFTRKLAEKRMAEEKRQNQKQKMPVLTHRKLLKKIQKKSK